MKKLFLIIIALITFNLNFSQNATVRIGFLEFLISDERDVSPESLALFDEKNKSLPGYQEILPILRGATEKNLNQELEHIKAKSLDMENKRSKEKLHFFNSIEEKKEEYFARLREYEKTDTPTKSRERKDNDDTPSTISPSFAWACGHAFTYFLYENTVIGKTLFEEQKSMFLALSVVVSSLLALWAEGKSKQKSFLKSCVEYNNEDDNNLLNELTKEINIERNKQKSLQLIRFLNAQKIKFDDPKIKNSNKEEESLKKFFHYKNQNIICGYNALIELNKEEHQKLKEISKEPQENLNEAAEYGLIDKNFLKEYKIYQANKKCSIF